MKTYLTTSNPFGQLIIPRAIVQTMLWLPGVFLGAVSACTLQLFCGLVAGGLIFLFSKSIIVLGLLMQAACLAAGNSAASCNAQLLLSCQTYLRNSALNSSVSALVKLPGGNRKKKPGKYK